MAADDQTSEIAAEEVSAVEFDPQAKRIRVECACGAAGEPFVITFPLDSADWLIAAIKGALAAARGTVEVRKQFGLEVSAVDIALTEHEKILMHFSLPTGAGFDFLFPPTVLVSLSQKLQVTLDFINCK